MNLISIAGKILAGFIQSIQEKKKKKPGSLDIKSLQTNTLIAFWVFIFQQGILESLTIFLWTKQNNQ